MAIASSHWREKDVLLVFPRIFLQYRRMKLTTCVDNSLFQHWTRQPGERKGLSANGRTKWEPNKENSLIAWCVKLNGMAEQFINKLLILFLLSKIMVRVIEVCFKFYCALIGNSVDVHLWQLCIQFYILVENRWSGTFPVMSSDQKHCLLD